MDLSKATGGRKSLARAQELLLDALLVAQLVEGDEVQDAADRLLAQVPLAPEVGRHLGLVADPGAVPNADGPGRLEHFHDVDFERAGQQAQGSSRRLFDVSALKGIDVGTREIAAAGELSLT